MSSTRIVRETHERPRVSNRAADLFVSLLLLVIAGYYAITTFAAIVNFAWRQPMFDQWRSYGTLIPVSFPENVFRPDNGHRPIVPNLFRVAEMKWFAADQLLQISVGTLCIYLTFSVLAVCAWRERSLPLVARAGGVLLAALGVLWLGNARMLLHGNESLHAYLITLSVVSACVFVWRAKTTGHVRWFGIACFACAVATFCFGPGIASFAAVFLLGIVMRVPARWLLVPTFAAAACLFVYLFALPGDEGVRGVLDLRPIESAKLAAQWLSSPWVHGWIGLADPIAPWMSVNEHDWSSRALAATANDFVFLGGGDWRRLGIVIAFVGIIAFCARTAFFFVRRVLPTRLETLAIGVGAFALASAAIIGIARYSYLAEIPDQVYADRYLLWPSLFWCSLALLLLVDATRAKNGYAMPFMVAFLLLLPGMLFVSHKSQTMWGAAVYRTAQRNAAALRSGVFDEPNFPGNGDENPAGDLRTLDLLREQRLAMFADPLWQEVGKKWNGTFGANPQFVVYARPLQQLTDGRNGKPAAHVEGWVESGVRPMQKGGRLAIVDDQNVIAGLGEYSFISFEAAALRADLPRKRGFDAYIRDYDPGREYRLVWLPSKSQDAVVLATLTKL